MKVYDDGQASIYLGDVRDVLRELPEQSVHTVVSSPPYWGLRDYGTATWDGGDAECGHLKPILESSVKSSTLGASTGGRSEETHRRSIEASREPYRDTCGLCGAKRIDRQLGLERTPDEYVANMVAVFREVRRVLRDDGTIWVNLGDSYAANGPRSNNNGSTGGLGRPEQVTMMNKALGMNLPAVHSNCKPKDLVGIPWMVAFALRADGWYLRSDIIWAKPNPMPESVTDRPTKAHEYLFLLSKRERYFYDADAIREANNGNPNDQIAARLARASADHAKSNPTTERNGIRIRDKQRGHSRRHAGFNDRWDAMTKEEQAADGRNKRTVWTIATQPYPEAHFATYPEALVEPCILAGSPAGGTVLDPFLGSGTSLAVAKRLGRRGVGIELNPEYIELAKRRCSQMGMVFVE